MLIDVKSVEERTGMDFEGKSIIVTGGSLGMGRACSERFAAGGGQVLIVANDAASVEKAVADIGGGVRGFVGDVRNAGDMQRAVAQAVTAHSGVDILACCAGIQRYGTVVDTPENVWDDVMDINLKGIYLASKFAIPEMKRRGGGAIVAISSVQAYASQSGVAAYTASKGAINALIRAMSLDHAADNITVNAVCPASIDTPMLRHSADLYKGAMTQDELIAQWGKGHPIGRVGRASEVAELVAFLARDKARFITGADMKIDGGAMAKLGIVLPD
jgi:NAD(P)-dependent dehydrogenase (short-subunit alcohol dehydrogenase family)